MKNKKLVTIISIIILALVLYFGYNTFLAPKGVEGSKEITMEIIVEEEGINESFNYKTDHEFLYELMAEKQDELKADFEDTTLGHMITKLMDYTADPNGEYFHILINNEDAMTGVDEIPIIHQDNYIFELRSW